MSDLPGSAVIGTAPVLPARRALIIDDEAPIRAAMKRYFKRRGWESDEAPDGATALDLLLGPAEPPFALILSDLRMPTLSGMALHERLERERPALLARLVFSTGDTSSPDAAPFVARTTCPVLLKPFELAALDAIVAAVLARTEHGRLACSLATDGRRVA